MVSIGAAIFLEPTSPYQVTQDLELRFLHFYAYGVEARESRFTATQRRWIRIVGVPAYMALQAQQHMTC